MVVPKAAKEWVAEAVAGAVAPAGQQLQRGEVAVAAGVGPAGAGPVVAVVEAAAAVARARLLLVLMRLLMLQEKQQVLMQQMQSFRRKHLMKAMAEAVDISMIGKKNHWRQLVSLCTLNRLLRPHLRLLQFQMVVFCLLRQRRQFWQSLRR